MADEDFDTPEAEIPDSIGEIEIVLHDPNGSNANRKASGSAQVLNADGEVISFIRARNVNPLLTNEEKQQLAAILDKLRTKAESKL